MSAESMEMKKPAPVVVVARAFSRDVGKHLSKQIVANPARFANCRLHYVAVGGLGLYLLQVRGGRHEISATAAGLLWQRKKEAVCH